MVLTAKKGAARRLWSYILAYKKMISKNSLKDGEKKSDGITLVVMPTLDQTQHVRATKKNVKKHS